MRRQKASWAALALWALVCFWASAAAAVPTAVPFVGRLTTDAGSPYIADGSAIFELSLHPGSLSAASLWGPHELTNVPVWDGFFSLTLGGPDTAPLSASLLATPELWLQVSVNGQALSPRLRILSVPYALVAARAEAVGTLPASQVVGFSDVGDAALSNQYADLDGLPSGPLHRVAAFGAAAGQFEASALQQQGDRIGLGTTTPQATLDVAGGVRLGFVAACTASNEGTLRYNTTLQLVEVCTATGWAAISGGTPAPCEQASFSTHPANVSVAPNATAQFSASLAAGAAATWQWEQSTNAGATWSALANGGGISGASTSQLTVASVTTAQNGHRFRVVVTDTCGASITSNPATLTVALVGKRVFVTSVGFTGNMGGVTGADTRCQQRATAAGLTGTYKAWLSGSTLASSPSSRFTKSTSLPYVRLDGAIVANNWADLTSGSIQNPINVDEFGNPMSGSMVWSFTRVDGTQGLFGSTTSNCYGGDCHCNNWTITATQGSPTPGSAVGRPQFTTSQWTDYSFGNFCGSSYPIYCFEQ